jgi:hypothetical protein
MRHFKLIDIQTDVNVEATQILGAVPTFNNPGLQKGLGDIVHY